jgi:hypothetical protein
VLERTQIGILDWLWRDTNGGTTGIGPRGVNGNEFPNTNAYQNGIVVQTNWMIANIKPGGSSDGSYSFDLVKAPPADSCANVDCNQGTSAWILLDLVWLNPSPSLDQLKS